MITGALKELVRPLRKSLRAAPESAAAENRKPAPALNILSKRRRG